MYIIFILFHVNSIFLNNKSNFLFKQILEQEKLSANCDLNLDPLVSSWVPLPLDNLHSLLLTAP